MLPIVLLKAARVFVSVASICTGMNGF